MQPNKLAVAIVLAIARLCSAGIILKSVESDSDFELDRAAINLIISCWERGGRAVAVGGTRSETLIKALSTEHIPVVLVSNSSGIAVRYNMAVRKYIYKLHVFVITVVTEIKNTVWWNHMAYFLIIGRTCHGCSNVEILLFEAWLNDMVHANVLCHESNLGIQILGYNPYTTEAPKPWSLKLSTTYNDRQRFYNRFSVFERSYGDGTKICVHLKIDKTKNLSYWPIELLLMSYKSGPRVRPGGNIKYLKSLGKVQLETFKKFWDFVNGSHVYTAIDADHSELMLSPSHFKDMSLSSTFLVIGLRFPIGPTYRAEEWTVLTQRTGTMSQLRKLISVVDVYSNIGICVVLLVTMLFFKVFVGIDATTSFLNIVRIVCDDGFTNVPTDASSRVFITSVLMFGVTMLIIYQSNWSSDLTTDIPLPNIDTYLDLVESAYTIYVVNKLERLFTDSKLKGQLVELNGTGTCVKWVLQNSSAACFQLTALSMDNAEEYDLHLSQSLQTVHVVHIFRPDWPLEDKFKCLIRKLVEADILGSIEMLSHKISVSKFNENRKMRNNTAYRVITIDDLNFAFVILGIGLTCATMAFFFEILIERLRATCRTRRRRITHLDC